MARLKVLGLLGGIGSGKSTVAGLFEELGAVVLDADRIAHRCLEQASVKNAVLAEFGAEILAADGQVDRHRLGAIVFRDEARLRRLNTIVHPCVRQEIQSRIEQLRESGHDSLAVLDVPLLLESESDSLCDRRLFVSAPLRIRRERVARDRGWSEDELARREKIQKSIEAKEASADYKIVNDGAFAPIRAQVRAIFLDLFP